MLLRRASLEEAKTEARKLSREHVATMTVIHSPRTDREEYPYVIEDGAPFIRTWERVEATYFDGDPA